MAFEAPSPEALPAIAARGPGSVRFISIVLLLVSVCFAIGAQLTLKSAMNEIGRIGRKQVGAPIDTIARVAKEPKIWIGLGLFGISALFWLVVLSRVPLSVAYPFVGVSYIAIVLFARLFLHEPVPPLRWIGVLAVAAGIAVIGMSFLRTPKT